MLRCSFLLGSLLALGCSHGSVGPMRQGDGGYQLECKAAPLTDCLRQAERACPNQGYTVTSARDVHDMLGNESGQSQVVVQRSEATFYCGKLATSTERPMIELKREKLEGVPPKPEATPTPVADPTPPPRACVPGITQTCIGPGGCHGGQACDSDGTHFNPCDCGNPPPP